VHGPYEPEKGLRFNPAKLLLDPYAVAIDWHGPTLLPYVTGDSEDRQRCGDARVRRRGSRVRVGR
jgi:glycogen operon protein